jgi:type VI secretion system protein ImpM
MMNKASGIGFYGKLPCKGDFLQRRVPCEFVEVWDAWVQSSLNESKRQLDDRWLDVYLTSPVWRFVLAAGLCGTDSYAGVLVPSVDRVGRYFPLTIVARWELPVCVLQTAFNLERWFDLAESLARDALDATCLNLEDFDRHVIQLSSEIEAGAGRCAGLPAMAQKDDLDYRAAHWYLPLASTRSLQDTVEAVATRELERILSPLSLWWTEGSDHIGAGMLCVNGLPEPGGFAAMLSGEQAESGWTQFGA